jgi:hypothetical protein
LTSVQAGLVIAAVTVTAPPRSGPRPPATQLSAATGGMTTTGAGAAGTLIKNTHRHGCGLGDRIAGQDAGGIAKAQQRAPAIWQSARFPGVARIRHLP